jgi:DNA modification methylase
MTTDNRWEVRHGDCRDIMRTLPDNSVDAIVSDPPYGLAFMGKEWDHGVPGVEFWTEALRVAKPAAHLVAFGGTRTFHRLAVAIEDAGWEVRDCLSWLYGSGFPKSHDIGKAIDKMDAAEEQMARRYRFTAWMRDAGMSTETLWRPLLPFAKNEATAKAMAQHYVSAGQQPAIMTREHLEACRHLLGDIPEWVERECDIRSVESRNFAEREVVGHSTNAQGRGWSEAGLAGYKESFDITRPSTDAAKQWDGWGTALKPAWEPIVLARKPLVGTVAANVTQYGTGGINVDGCRIGDTVETWPKTRARPTNPRDLHHDYTGSETRTVQTGDVPSGRWPANVCLDEDAAALFPESRFFYTAKASRREREAGCESNGHPTIKPIALMRWLCRLVTPPDGLVLDPFNGSGSTGCAAVLEGFRYLGAELDADYVEIARKRIAYWASQTPEPDLFG